MDYQLLKKLTSNRSDLNAFLEFSYECTKPYVNELGSPIGNLFQRQIVTEAYLAFINIQDISKPYELLPTWSEISDIPHHALEAYLDLITINLELLRNSPNPLETLKELMRNA